MPIMGAELARFTYSENENPRPVSIGDLRKFPICGNAPAHTAAMAASMQNQLGQDLRKRRGERTLPAFARKLGISSSSLHRIEMGEQNVTLATLERLLKRLKCRASDIFDGPRA